VLGQPDFTSSAGWPPAKVDVRAVGPWRWINFKRNAVCGLTGNSRVLVFNSEAFAGEWRQCLLCAWPDNFTTGHIQHRADSPRQL